MASDKDFVEFIVGQIKNAGEITYRKMFGEYAVYCKNKVVTLICDNKVFVKPTTAGRDYIGDALTEAPPYPGAKNSFLLECEFEDSEWFSELIRLTYDELPEPKPKKKK